MKILPWKEFKLTGVLEPVTQDDLGTLATESRADGGDLLLEVLPGAQEMRDPIIDDGGECAAPEVNPLLHLLLAPRVVVEGAGDRHHAVFEYGVQSHCSTR